MPHAVVPEVDPETSEASCEDCGEHVDMVMKDDLEVWIHASEMAEIADLEYEPL